MLIKGILRKSVDWIEGTNSTMAENLASVEQDVERRRVDKNPFEQKFRSLVRAITAPSLIIYREYGDDGVAGSFESVFHLPKHSCPSSLATELH